MGVAAMYALLRWDLRQSNVIWNKTDNLTIAYMDSNKTQVNRAPNENITIAAINGDFINFTIIIRIMKNTHIVMENTYVRKVRGANYDDLMTGKHFPYYWSFASWIHHWFHSQEVRHAEVYLFIYFFVLVCTNCFITSDFRFQSANVMLI